jgi:hypothetical protein
VTKLPVDIQIEFFKVLNGEMAVENFEQWLYKNKNIETHFEQADYLNLISLNFRDRQFRYEMKKIADKYLDYGEFEKRKLQKILHDLISKTPGFAGSLIATYNLYCRGYRFFDHIALGYGLTFADDFYEFRDWEELTIYEKNKRINQIYDGVKAEAEKIQYWLDKEKIILTGEVDEIGHYSYRDNRSDEDKKPTVSPVTNLGEQRRNALNSAIPKAERTWWQKVFSN